MNSRLVDVQDLVIGTLHEQRAQVLHELQLLLAELLILSHALPELVVGALVLDTEINVVLAKSHAVE